MMRGAGNEWANGNDMKECGRGVTVWLLTTIASISAAAADLQRREADWPLYGHNYANHRFSPLRQIHRDNVTRLRLAWRYTTDKRGSFQTSPIVQNDVLYLTTPLNDVIALDAESGTELWRYRHRRRKDHSLCCGPANRGPAVAHGKVYTVTVDVRLLALDRATGKVLWDTPMAIPDAGHAEPLQAVSGIGELQGARVTGHSGYGANMAPQVVGEKILAGVTGAGYGLHLELEQRNGRTTVGGLSGGSHGLRGFLAAYDAHTGTELWRWYSVPEQGWEGEMAAATAYGVPMQRDPTGEREALARHRDSWRHGGGSIWTTPAVDTELGLIYLGTGNPAPQMADTTRPGDNLYTVSLVALELETGRLRWHYQQVPHDRWGYDVASPPVLFELELGGNTVKAVGQASKLGWFFVHDRQSGRLLFRSQAFVPQENLFAAPTDKGTRIAPSTFGAVSWSPTAYHPDLKTIFIAAIHQPSWFYSRPLEPSPGRPWTHVSFFLPAAEESWGALTAVQLPDGAIRWQQRTPEPLVGGVLATAGGLIFTGQGNGRFIAADTETGRELWHYQAPYGVNAPPISYAVNNRQYVAVAAGGNALFGYATGDLVLAFTLDGNSNAQ